MLQAGGVVDDRVFVHRAVLANLVCVSFCPRPGSVLALPSKSASDGSAFLRRSYGSSSGSSPASEVSVTSSLENL